MGYKGHLLHHGAPHLALVVRLVFVILLFPPPLPVHVYCPFLNRLSQKHHIHDCWAQPHTAARTVGARRNHPETIMSTSGSPSHSSQSSSTGPQLLTHGTEPNTMFHQYRGRSNKTTPGCIYWVLSILID